MRKAAQSKGRRGGKPPAGPGAAGRRGTGGPTGPKPKRFLDYPRWGKRGVRRWLPSWKQMLSVFLLGFGGVVGVWATPTPPSACPGPMR
ncbi:hypothetical protein GXW82_33500 [Streptacidiphilus sp. 4-A2]|nr:hypothetical protein [Streptacidiphilus sp. 4-A2]